MVQIEHWLYTHPRGYTTHMVGTAVQTLLWCYDTRYTHVYNVLHTEHVWNLEKIAKQKWDEIQDFDYVSESMYFMPDQWLQYRHYWNATIFYVRESSTLCTSSYRLWLHIYNLSLSLSYYKGCTTTNSYSTAPATQLPINCNLKWYGPPLLLLWYTKQRKHLSLLTGQLASVHWFDVIVEFAQHLLKPHPAINSHSQIICCDHLFVKL